MEYYVVGHDTPESLYDAKLAKSSGKNIALMFAGIGDARNLHLTFMQICNDRLQGKHADRTFHCTLVDCKPAVIARDLVIMLLLHDLSELLDTPKPMWQSLVVRCLYYTYLSPIMPRKLAEVLALRVQRAVDMLENKHDLLPYLDVPKLYRSPVVEVLKQWQHEVHPIWPASKLREAITHQRQLDRMQWNLNYSATMGPPPMVATSCKKEQFFFEQTGIMPMPTPHDKIYSESIQSAFDASTATKVEQWDTVISSVDREWSANVTYIDLAWLKGRSNDDGQEIDVGEDP